MTEGRDQGTVAFPDAECKIFLTASPAGAGPAAAARPASPRRAGHAGTGLAAQERRDREDAGRPVGPLRPAPDAVEVSHRWHDVEEVVDRLEKLADETRQMTKHE